VRKRLLSIVFVTATLLSAGVPAAFAMPRDVTVTCADSRARGETTIAVNSIPRVAGFTFTWNGAAYTTASDGTVKVPTPPKTCDLSEQFQGHTQPIALPGNRSRAVFASWKRRSASEYSAAFRIEYTVALTYVDLQKRPMAASKLESVRLKSSLGSHVDMKPGDTVWLTGTRVVPQTGGLFLKRVYWTVDTVKVLGVNVVVSGRDKFYPDRNSRPTAHLLFYKATFRAHDLLFGFGTGSGVKLRFPNGKVEEYRFAKKSKIDVDHLPRGDYKVTPVAPGLALSSPVAITRDQFVDVKVLSYLDILVIAFVGIALAVGLVVLGRRSRARRDKEDLEPPETGLMPA
jgi:hypothetical protein